MNGSSVNAGGEGGIYGNDPYSGHSQGYTRPYTNHTSSSASSSMGVANILANVSVRGHGILVRTSVRSPMWNIAML